MRGRDDASQPDRDEGQPDGTERLSPTGADWSNESDTVNPGWRSERARTTTRRRAARRAPTMPSIPPLPRNAGEVAIWLQRGGWYWLALVAGAIVLMVVFLALRSTGSSTASTADEPDDTVVNQATSFSLPTASPPPAVPVGPAAPQAFVVSGTAEQGLLLRTGPGTENEAIKTLPEGTRLEALGEEQQGGDYIWVKVRDAEGVEGWVARDFVTQAS